MVQRTSQHDPPSIYYPYCKKTIWKYNGVDHITADHPRLNTINFDKYIVVNIQTQEQEGRCVVVLPEFMDIYRNKYSYLFPQEADLAVTEKEAEQEREHVKKRSRRTVGGLKSKKQRR